MIIQIIVQTGHSPDQMLQPLMHIGVLVKPMHSIWLNSAEIAMTMQEQPYLVT
jgi:hypothetical protein